MILYRGFRDRPRLLTKQLQHQINTLRENTPLDVAELNKLQFFSDRRDVAEECAGPKGYILSLDIPDKEAKEHLEDELVEMQIKGVTEKYLFNFVFDPREINEYFDAGKISLFELNPERDNEIRAGRR